MSRLKSENTPQLISAQEAVKLITRYGTIGIFPFIEEVAEVYRELSPAEQKEGYFYNFYFFATLFEAGRIQGIREERRKKSK